MSAYLALTLCVCFCGWFLWRDPRAKATSKVGLWVGWLWFSFCYSRSLAYWFGSLGRDEGGEGQPLDQVFLSTLAVIAGCILVSRRQRVSTLLRENAWLVAVLFYMGLSAFWSENPPLTLKRWIRILVDLVVALMLLTEGNPLEAIVTVVRRSLGVLLPVSVVLCKYFPSLGRHVEKHWAPSSWIGVTVHKNGLAVLCVLAVILILWHRAQTRSGKTAALGLAPLPAWIPRFYLPLSAYLFIGSRHMLSTTALVTLVLSSAFMYMLHRHRQNIRLLVPVLAFVGSLYLCGDLLTRSLMHLPLHQACMVVLGKSPTMTDRTTLWDDLTKVAKADWLLGPGFGAFWRGEAYQQLLVDPEWSWTPLEAHNGYLEMYLQLGLAGLLTFLCAVVSASRSALRAAFAGWEAHGLRVWLLSVVLIHNIAESGFARPNNRTWVLFLLVAFPWRRWLASDSRSPGRADIPAVGREEPVLGVMAKG